ncbi:hypothetical protein CU633_15265 [Bacillus sp. V3-13]|uniref:DUF2399 domain-containing protein n=1 Tax=Bacillus sp. V3-13 TaxID=2053728 RepID=UPI000C779065|nr:DUF2399 domain-containing protein [Bacillus sp. V3-13]PLR76548.1 hypothetical protein CU633_15265 [Bacillus sp. V3-13]
MNTSESVVSSNSCRHIYKYKNNWGPFEKVDSQFIRLKSEWRECTLCKKKGRIIYRERERYGNKNFLGRIEDFLPEEYREAAIILLNELYKKNNKKIWSRWKKNLFAAFSYETIIETLEALNSYGVVILRERNDKTRISHWDKTHIYYNDKYITDIRYFLGIPVESVQNWLNNPFPLLMNEPTTDNSEKIKTIIMGQKEQYELTGKGVVLGPDEQVVVSSSLSFKGYMKFIRILYGLYENIENNYNVYWKPFSQRIFGNTKEINKADKKRVELIFGKDLSSVGILPERHEVLVSGDLTWELQGAAGTSQAFMDYVPFPAEMIHKMKITSWNTSCLLIVENQDLFLSIVKGKLLDKSKWAILLGRGFLSSGEIHLVIQACIHKTRGIYVWPDLDPYGYQIAEDITRKIKKYNVPVYLFGYNKDWFMKSGIYKPLEKADEKAIDNILVYSNLHKDVVEVLSYMKDNGAKAEQEILIDYLDNKLEHVITKKSISMDSYGTIVNKRGGFYE